MCTVLLSKEESGSTWMIVLSSGGNGEKYYVCWVKLDHGTVNDHSSLTVTGDSQCLGCHERRMEIKSMDDVITARVAFLGRMIGYSVLQNRVDTLLTSTKQV